MKEDGQSGASPGVAPPDTRVYAVGDVHGQLALLERLMARIREDAARRTTQRSVLVFLGDYIDRGPDSAGVIDYLVHKLPPDFEAHCLLGNHEHALLAFLEDPAALPQWLLNGAAETLMSYGVEPPSEYDDEQAFARCRDTLAAAMPTLHRSFLEGLKLYVELGDYLFVHAGIRPGVPLDRQSRRDMLWIRNGFLDCDDDLCRIVVHGHTPVQKPEVRRNRFGIDTGAWAYGCLTALRLEGTSYKFLQVREGDV